MPYYMAGDYYQGDYYQAGGLGSFLGNIAKKAAGAVFGATPLGTAVKIGQALVSTAGPRRPVGLPVVNEPGFGGLISRILPGGSTGLMVGPGPGPLPGFMPGSFRKRRRMNVLNIRALRRAMRRAKGFERQARRVGSFFSPGKTYKLKGRGRRKSA